MYFRVQNREIIFYTTLPSFFSRFTNRYDCLNETYMIWSVIDSREQFEAFCFRAGNLKTSLIHRSNPSNFLIFSFTSFALHFLLFKLPPFHLRKYVERGSQEKESFGCISPRRIERLRSNWYSTYIHTSSGTNSKCVYSFVSGSLEPRFSIILRTRIAKKGLDYSTDIN